MRRKHLTLLRCTSRKIEPNYQFDGKFGFMLFYFLTFYFDTATFSYCYRATEAIKWLLNRLALVNRKHSRHFCSNHHNTNLIQFNFGNKRTQKSETTANNNLKLMRRERSKNKARRRCFTSLFERLFIFPANTFATWDHRWRGALNNLRYAKQHLLRSRSVCLLRLRF